MLSEDLESVGFVTKQIFSDDQTTILKDYVTKSYLQRLQEMGFDTEDESFDKKIENYHLLDISDDRHKEIWGKDCRKLPESYVAHIVSTDFYKTLETSFSSMEIPASTGPGVRDMNWRLVRPNKEHDVGPYHTDRWFDIANKWDVVDDQFKLKVWVMLSKGDVDRGLNVVPNSTDKTWDYRMVHRDGILKPTFDEDAIDFAAIDVITPYGHGLIFGQDLLHKGLVNTFSECRVSMDFVLLCTP